MPETFSWSTRFTWQRQLIAFGLANVSFTGYQVLIHRGGIPQWYSDPRAIAYLTVPSTATVIFTVLLLQSRPGATSGARAVTLYLIASTAAFGISMLNAVFRVIWPVPASEQAPQTDLWQLGWRVTAAGLAIWLFFIVRSWKLNGHNAVSFRGQRRLTSPRAYWRCWLAAATAFLMGELAAAIAQGELKDKFGLAFNENSHPRDGQFGDWLLDSTSSGLAGLQEEPVIVGVAVLLWPGRRLRRLVRVAALTSACRALPHLYYAAGGDIRRAALVSISVVIWSAIWSTGALLAVYYSRSLAPIIVAHGLWNSLSTAIQHWDVPMGLRVVQGTTVFVVFVVGFLPLFDAVWTRMWRLAAIRLRKKASVRT